MRVQEEERAAGFEGGPDGAEGWVVEAGAETGSADYDALAEGEGGEARDFGGDVCGGCGQGEGAEVVELLAAGVVSVEGVAGGVDAVVDGEGCRGGCGGGEEVEPGVGEGDDGDGDRVGAHELAFDGEVGIGGVDGAAAVLVVFVWIVVGGEDNQSGVCTGCWFVDVGNGLAGREQVNV